MARSSFEFGIPSDFVIRHPGLRIAVHGSPVPFFARIGTMNFRAHGVPASAGQAGLATRGRLKAGLQTNVGSWKAPIRFFARVGTLNLLSK